MLLNAGLRRRSPGKQRRRLPTVLRREVVAGASQVAALDNTIASSLPSKGRISLPARRLSVRKTKEVLEV
jgi:hypothetical protein